MSVGYGIAKYSAKNSLAKAPHSSANAVRRSLAGLVHDAQRHAADVDRVGDLELADDESDEIRGEEHRVGEPHAAAAVADRLVRDLP